ncbi:MAG: T9SS type A sorting domain-containing protein [Bacteroidota bacterium]
MLISKSYHRTLLFFLLCSPLFLFAQMPRTIIIASDNGRGNDGDLIETYELEPFDEALTNPPCQELIPTSRRRRFRIDFNDLIQYTPTDPVSSIFQIEVTYEIQHRNIPGGFVRTEVFNVQDLNVVKGVNTEFVEIPLNFGVDLRLRRRLRRRLNMQITIATRPTGLTNLPPGVFEFKSTGLYTSRICRRGQENACPGANNHRTSGSAELSESFQAFPNPFQDYLELRIDSPENEQPKLKFMDMQGREISVDASLKFAGDGQWIGSLSTKDLPPGIYLLHVFSEDYPEVIKLLKK